MSLIVGRLYLGVHSPTDIRGGIALGTALGLLWHRVWPIAEEWVLRGAGVGVFSPPLIVTAGLALFLILHPQPVPQTPTFLQNALLAGLVSGLMHGSRSLGRDSMDLASGAKNYILRVVIGYCAVLAGRGALKALVQKALLKFGIDAKAGAGKSSADDKKSDGDSEAPTVKAWDLFGAAVTKFIVYHFIAWMITSGSWPMFRALGLVK